MAKLSNKSSFSRPKLFRKIFLNETRPLIKNCMMELDYAKEYLTISKGVYSHIPILVQNSTNLFSLTCQNSGVI
jgi:hypothetical protein